MFLSFGCLSIRTAYPLVAQVLLFCLVVVPAFCLASKIVYDVWRKRIWRKIRTELNNGGCFPGSLVDDRESDVDAISVASRPIPVSVAFDYHNPLARPISVVRAHHDGTGHSIQFGEGSHQSARSKRSKASKRSQPVPISSKASQGSLHEPLLAESATSPQMVSRSLRRAAQYLRPLASPELEPVHMAPLPTSVHSRAGSGLQSALADADAHMQLQIQHEDGGPGRAARAGSSESKRALNE